MNLHRLLSMAALFGACLLSAQEKPEPLSDSLYRSLAATPPMGWNSWNKFGCNVSEQLVKEIADAVDLPEDKVDQLMSLNSRAVSTDAPIDDQDDTNFLDIYVTEDEVQTDSAVEKESTSRAIRRSLDMLNEKERTIICMYFGLGSTREYSLEEIAMKLNISRERTRQIRDRALKRLKTEPNSPLYQMYMNQ